MKKKTGMRMVYSKHSEKMHLFNFTAHARALNLLGFSFQVRLEVYITNKGYYDKGVVYYISHVCHSYDFFF